MKSSACTLRSDQITTCVKIAVAEALLMEISVLSPVGLFRSTSKYGNNSVAPGTSSTVPITACADAAHPSSPSTSARVRTLFMRDPPVKERRSGYECEPLQLQGLASPPST